MNIKKSLRQATKKLEKENIKNPHLEAEILLSNMLKKPREFLLAHPEKQLTKNQISNFKFQISRRLKGEPLAYITGHKEFYGLDFYVNKYVLIPRPETELMIDEAIRITRNVKRITLIDVGTGSGCIIISLVKLLSKKHKELSSGYPELSSSIFKLPITDYQFLATDISLPALRIARKNAKLHKVDKKIKFLHGNLLEPILNKSQIANRKSQIIITTNLPYLTPQDIKNSPTIQHEPRLALDAGPNGLKYYHQLFHQIKLLLDSRKFAPNLCLFVIAEINPEQTKKIKQLIKQCISIDKISIKKDLSGLNRLIIIKI